MRQDIGLGETVFSHPFGGLIYLRAWPNVYRESVINVTISGAVEAPHFVLGRDTNADWIATIRDKPAPMGEIEGAKMVVTSPMEILGALDTPEELTAKYDAVVDNMNALSGLAAAAPLPHTAPNMPARAVGERQLKGGAAHSGFPMGFGISNASNPRLGSMEYSTAGTFYHELGHVYQQPGWRCQGGEHGLNDIFTIYNQQIFGEPSRIQKNGGYDSVEIDLANGVLWDDLNDRAGKLVFYTQIALAFEWGVYTDIMTHMRENPFFLPGNLQDQCDRFLELASMFSGNDLRSHFAHYGISNTQAALDAVAAMNLPEPDPAVWTYREAALPLARVVLGADESMLDQDDDDHPPSPGD